MNHISLITIATNYGVIYQGNFPRTIEKGAGGKPDFTKIKYRHELLYIASSKERILQLHVFTSLVPRNEEELVIQTHSVSARRH